MKPHEKPVISVIIPALNEEKNLFCCLTSLSQQSIKQPFEVIVVDGGSTDKTMAVARSFKAKVIKQKKKGIGDARFLACQKASGTIIASTDADAIPGKDWLRIINDYFKTHPGVGGIAGEFELSQNSLPILKFFFRLGPLVSKVIAFFVGHHYFSGRNFAVRKDIYDQVGGFNRHLNCLEDSELSTRVAKVTKIAHLPHLKVVTDDRRWRGRWFKHIFTRMLPAYWYNVVLKNPNKKYNQWERLD